MKMQRMLRAVEVSWAIVIAIVVLLFMGLIGLILNADLPLGARLIIGGVVCILAIEVVTVLTDRDAS